MNPKPKPVKKSKEKKPKRSITTRAALISRAHAIMREIVLRRDGHCVCPPPERGHSSIRQAGHIMPSTSGGTRFSLWNVHEQCSACNGRHVRQWWYYQEWFWKKFGVERWLALQAERKNDGLKNYEIEEIIVQLREIAERQKREPEWLPYFTQAEILSGAWKNEAKKTLVEKGKDMEASLFQKQEIR